MFSQSSLEAFKSCIFKYVLSMNEEIGRITNKGKKKNYYD